MDLGFQKKLDLGVERKRVQIKWLSSRFILSFWWFGLIRLLGSEEGFKFWFLVWGDFGGLGLVQGLYGGVQQVSQENEVQYGYDNQCYKFLDFWGGLGCLLLLVIVVQLVVCQLVQRAVGGEVGGGIANKQQGFGYAVFQLEAQVGEVVVIVLGVVQYIEGSQLGQVVEGIRGYGAKVVIGQQEVAGVDRQGRQVCEFSFFVVYLQFYGFQGVVGVLCGIVFGGFCYSLEQEEGFLGRY